MTWLRLTRIAGGKQLLNMDHFSEARSVGVETRLEGPRVEVTVTESLDDIARMFGVPVPAEMSEVRVAHELLVRQVRPIEWAASCTCGWSTNPTYLIDSAFRQAEKHAEVTR